MTTKKPDITPRFEDRVFLGFVVVASLAMAWIASPFYGAVLWALVTAIVFAPVNDRLMLRMPTHRNTAAGLSLIMVILLVIVPAVAIGSLLVEEAIGTYYSIQQQEIDIGRAVRDVQAALPPIVTETLERFGLNDFKGIQDKLSSILTSGLRLIATQALNIGQGAFSLAISMGIMLYLTYFLLRDGRAMHRKIGEAVPMRTDQRRALFDKFITVIRATIKGSIVVAAIQGMLGGIVFAILDIQGALLWGVVMGVLSLVPAIGTALIWAPVALYLLATGAVWQGVTLILCGVFLIGMVDNVLRPILVGKDTRMPDYVVLISTLGGISVMGINGFIVGPVIAALFIASWEIFVDSRLSDRLGG